MNCRYFASVADGSGVEAVTVALGGNLWISKVVHRRPLRRSATPYDMATDRHEWAGGEVATGDNERDGPA